MGKYNFDKSALKGLGYSKFLNEVKERNRIIDSQEEEDVKFNYGANRLAASLHPHVQFVRVAEIKEENDAKVYTLVPDEEMGTKSLAYFRAGQYIALALQIGDSFVSRPYSICSNPRNAAGEENNFYQILVKHHPEGFVAPYIYDHFEVGTKLTISAPLGNFYYQDLRDEKHVIAAAGGSGITPFASMAAAISDGKEKFRMTILYGVKTMSELLLMDELREMEAKSEGRLRIIPVISDEVVEGAEHGFITKELLLKYAENEPFSLFACGPAAMYEFLKTQAEELKLPKRLVRFEVSAGSKPVTDHPEFNKGLLGKEFKLTVLVHGKEQVTVCRPEESLLSAVERAGIKVTSDCRNGECGWCHSRLVSGDVLIPEEKDGRRMADKTYGWIHPCVTYPKGDVSIEVFPIM